MDSELKRNRDDATETSVKPRKRRFDSGGLSQPNTSSAAHIQADISSLQQQVTALQAMGEESAAKLLQDAINSKQVELARAVSSAPVSISAPQTVVPQFSIAMPVPANSALAARIYVGAMPYDVTEIDVRNLFSQFGAIVKLDMSFEPLTGKM